MNPPSKIHVRNSYDYQKLKVLRANELWPRKVVL
jgi:hypothetical protein